MPKEAPGAHKQWRIGVLFVNITAKSPFGNFHVWACFTGEQDFAQQQNPACEYLLAAKISSTLEKSISCQSDSAALLAALELPYH